MKNTTTTNAAIESIIIRDTVLTGRLAGQVKETNVGNDLTHARGIIADWAAEIDADIYNDGNAADSDEMTMELVVIYKD